MHSELVDEGLTVVTVALDIDPEKARRWIERAEPTHPAVVDTSHRVDEALGITNVPMAVWIDESGTLVRPAETASIEPNELQELELDGFPDNIRLALAEAQKIPDSSGAYREAILDWVEHGSSSRFAMSPDEVVERSRPRPFDHSEAAACFELGRHLHETVGRPAAVSWWKRAHELHPDNWTYKRQAWTLESTPEGEHSDLLQEVESTYGTTWANDVIANGGGEEYVVEPDL